MSRIFLSHSSANNAEAIALRDWMVSCGWDDIFLDLDPERGLKAGERWQEALKRAAERCELVIFLVSPVWAQSKWCLAEFLLAKNLNKRIFGALIEPTPFEDLPTELTAEWQLADLTAGKRDFKATVTPPPGDKSAEISFSTDGLNRLRTGLMQSDLDPKYFAWPPEHDPDRAPYRGLHPLEEEDAGIFFGRDGPIVIGLDMLRGLRDGPAPRLLVILGASGAGKSSYMRAGLLPRLAREDHHFLPLPVLRPERAPVTGAAGLINCLGEALKAAGVTHIRAEITEAVNTGAEGVAAILTKLLEAQPKSQSLETAEPIKPPTLILPIDQAEELFLTEGSKEADTLLALLRDLSRQDAPALITLFTIRSDRYEPLQSAPHLAGMRQRTLSLPPVPKGAYAQIIRGPAGQLEGTPRALSIEEPLVDAILVDIEKGGAKDALPLLAFTLQRLYREYGGDGDLKLAEYHKLGGIKGSIEAAVERALSAADGNAKIPQDRQARLALLRRGLIPWLAGIDTQTGAPRRNAARLSEIPEEARPLIDLLIEQRLLSTDVDKDTGEVTVEPSHDSLLRQWGLLRGWLVEDTGLLSVLEGVKRAARDWAANGSKTAWLTHATHRLEDANRLLKERPDLSSSLEQTDRDYIAACDEHERAGIRRTRRVQIAFGVLVFLLFTAGAAWLNQDVLRNAHQWHTIMKPSVLPAHREEELVKTPGGEFTECEVGCPTMVVVPAGTFMMGSPETEVGRRKREGPQRKVTIARPFAVSKFEITFKEWNACSAATEDCVADNKAGNPDTHPVNSVSWNDAQKYVKWLSRQTGKDYRLLSEAEWEYAARGGSSTMFSFGDDHPGLIDHAWHRHTELADHAWYRNNAGGTARPVGQKQPNGYGLHDMHGNLWEWVEDCFASRRKYEGAPTDGSAMILEPCEKRGLRGGSWYYPHRFLRSANRNGSFPSYPDKIFGFRIARTLSAD